MGFMSFVCLTQTKKEKKRHSTSVGGEYGLWVLGGEWGKEGTTASTLRAACVGVDTNAPFTAAVQLAKDLNKQASTKYLEQPGLCLSVCFPLLFFSSFFRQHFSVSVLVSLFVVFFCNCYSTGLLKLNLLSLSRLQLLVSWVFCFLFFFFCLFALCFFRVPKCQTVPCRTCTWHIVFFDFEKTQGARHQKMKQRKREKMKLTHSFNWTESKV